MNAGLAKPIHRIWFIPERPLISIKSLPGPRLTRWVFAPLLASPWRDDPLRRSCFTSKLFFCDAQFRG
jgi:hypothetical protein